MKKLRCCSSGNGISKSTGCKVGLHQASTWGHVSRREERLLLLPEGCRIALRGHGRRGKRRIEERSLLAAALSKIDVGVDLFVRDVGVALLLCFYSGRRDICIHLLSLLRTRLKCFEIERVPSNFNMRSVYHDG